MKAIFINVRYKEVTYIDIGVGVPTLADMYSKLECELVQPVRVFAGHVMWVDEEALLHKDKLPGAFMLQNHVYGGHGLILGVTDYGEDEDCTLDVDQIAKVVKFIPIDWLPEPGFVFQTF